MKAMARKNSSAFYGVLLLRNIVRAPGPSVYVLARKMTALNANLRVFAGKLHYVTFGVITRNITRLIKTRISH